MGVFRRQWPGVSYGRGEAWHYVGDVGEPAFDSTLVNAGTGYPKLAFRIREGGIVDIEGVLAGSLTSGGSIFVLPEAYRPTSVAYIPIVTDDGPGWIAVGTPGNVNASTYAGNTITSAVIAGQLFLDPPAIA